MKTLSQIINSAPAVDLTEGTAWKLDESKSVRVPYVNINKDNLQLAEDVYKK